jgi:protein TonB
MRRDLIIGLAVALLFHAWLAFGFIRPPEVPAAPPPPTIEIIAVPPPDEASPPPGGDSPSVAAEPTPAPPQQADLPTVQLDAPFIQPLEPSPPPSLARPTGLIEIPTGRLGTAGGSGTGSGGILDLADLDEKPEVIPGTKKNPIYPRAMETDGISGHVLIAFWVDQQGNVKDPQILESSRREFEAPAVAAIRQWKFIPGKRGGRPVSFRYQLDIDFKALEGSP